MEFQKFDLKHSYSLLSWLTELFSADEYYVLPRLPFFMILSYSLCEHRKTCQRRIQAFKNGKSNRNQHMRTINVHLKTTVNGLRQMESIIFQWGFNSGTCLKISEFLDLIERFLFSSLFSCFKPRMLRF